MLKKCFLVQTIAHFLISQCSCGTILDENMNTTSDIGKIEQKEIILIENLLGKIENLDPKIKGEISDNVKQLITRAIKADEILIEKERIEKEKEFYAKVLSLFGVRLRMKTVADDLYPGGRKPFHYSMAKAFREILTSRESKFTNRDCVIKFRQRVMKYNISVAIFVDAVGSIYGSLSDNVAHKMSEFDQLLPKYNDKEGIKQMFEDFGMTPDRAKVKTVQIVLEPLPMLSSTKAPSGSTNSSVFSVTEALASNDTEASVSSSSKAPTS